MPRRRERRYERYPFEDSPWTQDLTQQKLAVLLGMTKSQLEAIVRDKEKFIRRQTKYLNGKLRNLAIPFGKLRGVHEHLKYHFNKIKQPNYIFSPRRGRSQRDNAELHAGQNQILSLDIRQFYPTTSSEHIFRWAHYVAGLRSDVAGMLVHLITIDEKMPFGSPVSPVLMTLVHRAMFEDIYAQCRTHDTRMSLWVDDIAVSGLSVPGRLVDDIRDAIRRNGFQSHKIHICSGARPIIVTGVPIESGKIGAPFALHNKIRDGYTALKTAETDAERYDLIERLLSYLGTYRYHVGAETLQGRKSSDRMNGLRRRRSQLSPKLVTKRRFVENSGDAPSDKATIPPF